ncbi:MAG: TetR/AcrR family transcriptional regulator [Desulfobacteraceae bacterium]|nr:TetR/AcrR family transcriptional regulator [Desulfobacteraceae bacterium]MBC2756968.1 TetR/AcrR family transcriptional regulator [Desulfobacteraceae bacterium]
MTGPEKTEARKSKILEAATKIFSEKGFQDATISEIAKAAGASDAFVYEYFSTKENLLFSIPREHMQKLFENIEFHLKLIRGAVNKLHATLYMQLIYYSEHPEFTAVLLLILKHNRKFINTDAHKEIRDYLKIVDRCLKEGVESGEIYADIDPYYLRATLIGSLEHIVINWLLRGKPENLMDAFEPMFEVCLKLIQKKPETPNCPLLSQKNVEQEP